MGYVLVRRSDFKLVGNIKVIPGENVVTQKKSFTPKLLTWKLKDQDVVRQFQDELNNLLESDANRILESVEGK